VLSTAAIGAMTIGCSDSTTQGRRSWSRDTGAGECFVTLTRTARISASQAGACRGKRIWGDW